MTLRHIYLCLIAVFVTSIMYGQSKKKLLIEGDFQFDMENYEAAEKNYEAANKKAGDFQSSFNLAVSQERQIASNERPTIEQMMQKAEENPNQQKALESYRAALNKATSNEERAAVAFNTGNTILKDKQTLSIEKIEEAIKHYKSAIQEHSKLTAAKHNLALAQMMLDQAKKQQEQQQQQQQQEQEKNQEQQEQKEQKQQEQENQEQEQQNQEQQEKQKQSKEEQQKQEQQQQEEQKKIDKKEIETLLKMVDKEDKQVQAKMRKKSGGKSTKKKKAW